MNKIYQVVWNATHLCWQAVSEKAKGGVVATQSTTKIKSKTAVAHTAKLAAFFSVNVLSASIVFAGPTGGVVSSGTASISTAGTTTTINQSTAKAAIDWSSFSTNSNEIVNFVQPNSSSITLNRVTGTSASNLNGQLNANGQVFIINPNGVLFGSTSQVNTAGLVASTLNLSNADFNNNLFNFNNPTNNKTIENRGKITVPTGGTVALIAPTVKQTGTIKAPQGNVLLAAGGDITLNLNNGSLLGYTINQGKAQALINSGGMIQADGGKVILTAKGIDELSNAVVNSVGVIQAQTVNNVRGVIELGSDLSSGTVNVSGTLDASAPNGGNGGQIKTSAAEVHVSSGTNITTQRNSTGSLPPTTSGWELKAKNVDVDFFGGSVSSTTLGDTLNKGNVTLNAMGTAEGQGNINVNDATSWNANTALTLTATKDINFNSDLDLSGDKAKLAMNYGTGSDYNLNNGAKINISGSSPTLLINGSSYIVINDLGEEGDANLNTLQGMNNNLTGNYALGSNIDASDTVSWNNGKGFEAIGQAVTELIQFEVQSGTPFQGSFHGLGHTIEGLTIQESLPTVMVDNMFIPQGLFSVSTGTLRDIGLVNTQINAFAGVGALSGYHISGNIKNAYSTGQVHGFYYVGGLIGIAGNQNHSELSGKISNSYSNSRIEGLLAVGGLVGGSTLPIDNSYATGDISLPNVTMSEEDEQSVNQNSIGGMYIGGLVGSMKNGISNSYATGNIRSGMYINNNFHPELGVFGAGGLVGGLNLDGVNHNIDQSYATGNVSGIRGVGGLVGITVVRSNPNQAQLYINNSFATGKVDGESTIGGLVGGNAANNLILGSYASGEVKGKNEVGGLIGSNLGKISNSYASNLVVGEHQVGGLVGYQTGSIKNSYASGKVYGEKEVGGLAGYNIGTIGDSYASGSITGDSEIGGLIGYQAQAGSTENSYAIGVVTGITNIGGLVGDNRGTVKNSYARGLVAGDNNVGGLIGSEYWVNGSVINSYWDTETSGQLSSNGGTGKTTAELQKILTFSGWDIADASDPNSTSIWVIDEDNATPWLRYNH